MEGIKKSLVFCHFLNNIGFLMKEALPYSVLWYRRRKIHSYVEAPLGVALTSQIYHTTTLHRYLSLQ
jgi:hypothetical protein